MEDTSPTQELRELIDGLSKAEPSAIPGLRIHIGRQLGSLDRQLDSLVRRQRLLEGRVSYLKGELQLLKQRPWWKAMIALEGVLRTAADVSMQRRHEQIDRIREREGTLR